MGWYRCELGHEFEDEGWDTPEVLCPRCNMFAEPVAGPGPGGTATDWAGNPDRPPSSSRLVLMSVFFLVAAGCVYLGLTARSLDVLAVSAAVMAMTLGMMTAYGFGEVFRDFDKWVIVCVMAGAICTLILFKFTPKGFGGYGPFGAGVGVFLLGCWVRWLALRREGARERR